jgi:hypothetical protein
MYQHFQPLVGDVLEYTQAQLAEEIGGCFFVEFPSTDGFPTIFPGQPDYAEIARIMQDHAKTLQPDADDEFARLGEEWLALQIDADLTDERDTNAACDKRMAEIEAALPPMFVAGLALALEWALRRQLREAIDA